MLNFYYKDSIFNFLNSSNSSILGEINQNNEFDTARTQNKSWGDQIGILKETLANLEGTIFFEFSIPRMGRRVDTILVINNLVFVIEFKVGEFNYLGNQIEQVWDYALDLKNFHEPSHKAFLIPILVCTEAKDKLIELTQTSHNDNLLLPILANKTTFKAAVENCIAFLDDTEKINGARFETGRYIPTPTIIEAAVSLFNSHTVDEITRNDAEAINLSITTTSISQIISEARRDGKKAICFVTGVPGAGKTLVGLKIATEHLDNNNGESSVYLSGNAPLVAILQEALTRDKVARELSDGRRITKREAKQAVKSFIQIIHHYRDAYLVDPRAPSDHVAIFDEAQRAWNKEQTVKFMKQKKNQDNFDFSEPEFLISCLNRHEDWAVIVCLVGGGQEINTGEAGISEWLDAISDRFNHWEVYISPQLAESEYASINSIKKLELRSKIHFQKDLHLAVSMRSFRAETLSYFIQKVLEIEIEKAQQALAKITTKYPIVVTRDLTKAKKWLKEKARGSERFGIVVSSQAQRLKPHAIDVKSPLDPVNWFLNGKDDVRSSFFLEDAATEFHIQGLELDWACLVWDGDLRFDDSGWKSYSFKGNKWQNIHNPIRKKYLINAYRVLLTRARQGMVIVVPEGNLEDHTRKAEYYDPTFNYLKSLGIEVI
jgi:hypothetical protein